MDKKVTPKKTVVDAFVEGARNGFGISANSMAPNVMFAFVLIQILNLTGLSDILGVIFQPVMGIFGLPGVAATVLIASFLSMGGGVGVAASLYSSGLINGTHISIMIPAIMLMGSLLQYMGRILGTANVDNKYYPQLFAICFINAILSMFVMRMIVSL